MCVVHNVCFGVPASLRESTAPRFFGERLLPEPVSSCEDTRRIPYLCRQVPTRTSRGGQEKPLRIPIRYETSMVSTPF